MPCHTRMKSIFLQGLLWLFLLQLGFMAVSLEPGYLDFDNLPDTNFSCIGRVVGGYYADTATTCQMFHVCTLGQNNETMDIRFLCLNGTVFEQSTRVCERIDEVDCEKSEQYYHLNNELYGGMDPLIIRGESEPPPIDPQTTPSTTTSVPTVSSTSTTPNPYFGTVKQTTPHQNIPHPYTSDSPADIRFDPNIINLQLNSDPSLGANIKPVSYQQQSYNDEKSHHTIVTTHAYKSDVPKTIYDNFNAQNLKPTDINYEFEYQDERYNPGNRKRYQNIPNYAPTAGELEDYADDIYKGSTYRTVYHTPSNKADTSTYKTPITFTPSSNPQTQYSFERTELPVKQQQPTPPPPPLPPIFSALSSPAPFAHSHHLEAKRNTDHHKIKKSFSLSISDQNGKELIKVNNTPISAIFPESYLDYKDDEATLLPIFEDVPRLQKRRPKRNSDVGDGEKVFKADPEATDVLRFFADWYTNYEKTTQKISIPLTSEAITEINDELSVEDGKGENALGDKEGNNGTDASPKKDHEYYGDEEYYYDEEEDEYDDGANRNSSDIVVSRKELDVNDDTYEIEKNGTSPKVAQGNVLQFVEEGNKNSTGTVSEEYIDDNYEAETYRGGKSYSGDDEEILPDSKKAEIDVNDVPKDVPPTPDLLYEYVDDNYEAGVGVNESENLRSVAKLPPTPIPTVITSTPKTVLTTETPLSTSSLITTPTIQTTTIMVTTTTLTPSTMTELGLERDVLTTVTTDPIYTSTEEHVSVTDPAYVKNDSILDENRIDKEYDSNTTQNLEVVEYTTDNHLSEEYLTTLPTTSAPSTTTETISTTENPHGPTTLQYSTQLSTEQTTFASAEAQASTIASIPIASSVMYRPEHTEVPIITTSYVTETSEASSEGPRLSENPISSSTTPTSSVIVKENLNEMIKDIEVETKSIAATIVMAERKGESPHPPTSVPKWEETLTEYLGTTTISAGDKNRTEIITTPPTSTTAKKPETTTRWHYRGRHTYYTRKTTTTMRPGLHRFNLQPRRRFDRTRNKPGILTDEKTSNRSSVVNVDIDNSNNATANKSNNLATASNHNATFVGIEDKTEGTHRTHRRNFGEAITDASLSKSANPTLAKETKDFLATTPISKNIRVKFKKGRVNKKYLFTCLDKKINKFYSDPRDCRLFHYCSQGYTSNQLVDMKFVCDLETYFDDVKLICTEHKPARCL